ncbi:hypothetical protein P154DRAFT_139509 [Amniculicola lignicola CBS 123094]|uniref:Uncharacterized protein n=1 Tax=Amniculicola lignicola CBS 123094 TaxID=1392246 RepID=A0A6A5WTR0_9PLEO|nr:hypothetical protein P154DRAFT_139509 [Amniculicola lignicola CBS 123094]
MSLPAVVTCLPLACSLRSQSDSLHDFCSHLARYIYDEYAMPVASGCRMQAVPRRDRQRPGGRIAIWRSCRLTTPEARLLRQS